MKYCLSIILLFFTSLYAYGQESVKISLLTIEPRSNEVYTIFGHTALRVIDEKSNTDIVFNWGTFDASAPHFIYRFMRGQTDYYLSTVDYRSFCFHYYEGGSTVIEQELNLSNPQKEKVLAMLADNLREENIVYLYNFLFDNCTTRVRDIIQKAYGDSLHYDLPQQEVSFRDLITSCTKPYPWLAFGIDLIIGSGADSLISIQQEMFLPEKLMSSMDKAYYTNEEGKHLPVVASRSIVLDANPSEAPAQAAKWNWPLIIGIALLIAFLALIKRGSKKEKTYPLPFALLFLLAAIGGLIVSFLMFFSIHPCVNPNWNIMWLQPLHLIAVVGFFIRKPYPLFYWYHLMNLLLLCSLLLVWFLIPQQLPLAAIPYVVTLGSVSAFTVWLNKRKRTK